VPEKQDINEYIESLKNSKKFGPQVVYQRNFPASYPSFKAPAKPIGHSLLAGLKTFGISSLYRHQAQGIDEIKKGNDLIVATPTASGKSLIYNIPVIEEIVKNHDSRALYLFPLKALAQDQLRTLLEMEKQFLKNTHNRTNTFVSIYDGDTSGYQRAKIRKNIPNILITNPDMLHLALLPYHDTWSTFFKYLKYVVIDEVHTYRGVFGAHMAWVLRRLSRIAHYYGSQPTFIMLSATIGNPGELGAKLINRAVRVIDKTGAPSNRRRILFINPWDSAVYTASQLLEAAMKRGLRTIVYTKSRKMTELVTMWTKPKLGLLASKLSSYRAGFLPEERRDIESQLSKGNLLGVITTSALELGIDIGDLDLCILVGYPGSIMATWQRSGRVGRAGQDSAVILIGGEDALDQHFMRNPVDFFTRKPEQAALNPSNTRISQQHLHCAAAEIPLYRNELLISNSPEVQHEINLLTENTVLYQESSGDYWVASRKRPQRLVDLRGGGTQLTIIKEESGEVIGEIDLNRALKETHPGAVYLHRSNILLVTSLHIEEKEVLVSERSIKYYTKPQVTKHTEIIETLQTKKIHDCTISWGKLRVTEKVNGYQKISSATNKIIAREQLELPEQVIETEGFWLILKDRYRTDAEDRQQHFMGAIHALEHTMIAMFPLIVLCDRNDIGGISCPYHEQTAKPTIFVYDGYNGGAGLSYEAFGAIDRLLEQTEKTIKICPCETGCPSCVHSPKCGSGNRPIDKSAALSLIHAVRNETVSDEPAAETIVSDSVLNGIEVIANKAIIDCRQPDQPGGLQVLPARFGVFDLETKCSAKEVGGWNRAKDMGMSVGVVYDSELSGYITYLEHEADRLVEHLQTFDLVIGFNNKRFDNLVLSAYTDFNLSDLPTLDLLEEVHNRLSYRLSLDRLAENTLGVKKSADGLQALQWYKEGKIAEIVSYCKQDVKVTKDLFLFALENSFLLFKNKSGSTVRLPLSIDKKIVALTGEISGRDHGQSSGL